jgi:hypothetical protein
MNRPFFGKEVTRIEFWRELCPQLTIEGSGDLPQAIFPSVESLVEHICIEGYVNEPGVLPLNAIEALRIGIKRLHENGIPPVFGFVYDEFWQIFRSLAPFLTVVLGHDYRLMPAFWAWYVEPTDAAAGWIPHTDRPGANIPADNMPDSLTIWLPLTRATPLNGCLYILPMKWDENFHRRNTQEGTETVLRGAQLQNIRALPAPPGSLLAWNQALFHWGGRASKMGTEPRCSISVEFQRGDRPPLAPPLIDPAEIPPFHSRLGLVGHMLLAYARYHGFNAAEMQILAVGLEWKYGFKS